jgi:hypothetical protein
MATDLTTYSQNGLDIYFQSQRAGLDAQLVSRLVNFINATQTSQDCAIYDLRQPDVLNALAGIAQAGKQLRIAYDASGQQSGAGDPAADPKPAGNEKALLADQTPILRVSTIPMVWRMCSTLHKQIPKDFGF